MNDYKKLCERLRGELLNCECHARCRGECCCSTDWPESFCDEAAQAIERLSEQRDELLAALERIEGATMSMYATHSDMAEHLQDIARAAIAKVKGQP